MTTLILAIVFIGLLGLGTPIVFVLMLTGVTGIVLSPGGSDILEVVPQQIFVSLDSFPLLTLPMFILAGLIMAEGGMARRLMDLAQACVGRGRGGLGAATVMSTMLFSGIAGSATAATVAVGKVVHPSLVRQGYPPAFSAGLLAASGASAGLVPPAIDLIIIGVIANLSIATLFAAAIAPALLNAFGLIMATLWISKKRGYGSYTNRLSLQQVTLEVARNAPILLMFVIVLGGIFGGIFTPTEAAVVAVLYSIFVSTVIYRDLRWSMVRPILQGTVQLTGIVMLIIAGSAVLSYALTINRIPMIVAEALSSITDSPLVFLLLVQLLFLLVGMVMDGLPALLVAIPILMPIAIDFGIDPIHFGILVETNLVLGLATPPVGMCIFAACAVARLPMESLIRPMIPLVAVLAVTLLIITYVEDVSLFLPRWLGIY